MKHSKALIILTAITLSTAAVQAQVTNADTMINKIFASLKAKDEKAFVALYPDGKQFGIMMRTMMEQMLNSEQMREMMANDPSSKNMNIDSLINAQVAQLSSPEAVAEMQKKFARTFQKLIEKGESKGVKWNEAALVNYTIDSTAAMSDGPDAEMIKSTGIKAMKGIIDFKVGDSAYQLAYDKIIFIPTERGWFGAEFPQLARKGESLQPDFNTEDMMATDSIKSEEWADTVAVKPKSKTKTKTKTPTSKTKTKTKTPARKPGTKS